MKETDIDTPELSSGQKKTLRAIGHHLEPSVYVGKEGLSSPLLTSTEAALKAHELIKIKLGQNCPLERKQAATELARQTEAVLVQLIGRMVLLYRANPKLPGERRIAL